MERIQTPETRTYRDGEFIVEIVLTTAWDGEPEFEAWLSAERCGIKEFMFGLPVKQPEGCADYTWELAEAVVEANLEEYEEAYREEIMEG